jgi:hypothetical protein
MVVFRTYFPIKKKIINFEIFVFVIEYYFATKKKRILTICEFLSNRINAFSFSR